MKVVNEVEKACSTYAANHLITVSGCRHNFFGEVPARGSISLILMVESKILCRWSNLSEHQNCVQAAHNHTVSKLKDKQRGGDVDRL